MIKAVLDKNGKFDPLRLVFLKKRKYQKQGGHLDSDLDVPS